MSACDFEELLRFKPESSRLVRDHIEHLKKSYHISNIDILIQAGVCLEDEKDRFGPKISKYIKDFDKHWRILGEEAHRKLVKYLLDNHFWGDEIDCRLVSSIPESLFVALRIFLEMGYMRTRNLQKRACGLYKTYRHSVTDPDKFAVGYMKVEKATANLALKVKLVEKSRDSGGDTPYREEYNGYLVRDSNCYFILCQGVNGMRISLFRRIEKKSGKESRIERLRGLTFGLAGSGLYGAAFVVEKSDKEESILEEEADIHNDIDHMIKGWLKRMKTDQFT